MNRKSELTLDAVKKSLEQKSARKSFRTSDLLPKEDLEELHKGARTRYTKASRPFDDIDALGAEICARFGYDAYTAWRMNDIPTAKMMRWVKAERAREAGKNLYLEGIIIKMVEACIRVEKGQKRPHGPKEARLILKEQIKRARGEI